MFLLPRHAAEVEIVDMLLNAIVARRDSLHPDLFHLDRISDILEEVFDLISLDAQLGDTQ